MNTRTVTWRQTIAAAVAVVVALVGVVVLFGGSGLPAVNASASGATRWFVHAPSGYVVLVDGYGGRALTRLNAESGAADQISIAEGGAGAYLLNETTAEVKPIETADLKFGAAVGLAALGSGRAASEVGPAGLTVVNPDDGQASALPLVGDSINFDVQLASAPVVAPLVVAPDGVVWTIDGPVLRQTNSTSSSDVDLGLGDGATLSLVGTEPLVLDGANRRARLGDGAWQRLDTDADPSEMVAQVKGPAGPCGWIGANDDLWCVAVDGITERATIDGLDLDGADRLAIAGDTGVVVRQSPSSIVRIDWRKQGMDDGFPMTVAPDAELSVTSTVDLIWVDDVAGEFVWAANPWEINAIDKNGEGVFEFGEEGTVADEGDVADGTTPTPEDPAAGPVVPRPPDDNGVDDPPVAVDDPVTARSGASVQVQVTANDYDPDGEAIAVSSIASQPGHGEVDIGTASTVVYTPDPGYVGRDQFDYSITDANGNEASATVVVELLPASATNSPPTGIADFAQTGPMTAVDVEVLLNDIDPERDGMRIGSFTPAENAAIGEVTETVGPSGLPALQFQPAPGFEGTATFSYRPVDALGGQGDDVDVQVEVAASDEANRPPVTRPDAIRARRNTAVDLQVLVNDIDPDGDDMALSVVTPLPPGLDVEVLGTQLSLVARTGAADLLPFQYEVSDGRGGLTRAWVLVDVIDDAEPNMPPVLTADSDTVIVGHTVAVDVLANDTDPDGDPLVIVEVSQPPDKLGQAVIVGDKVQFTPAPIGDRDDTNARFTYTVTDGYGHEVTADITVSILRESVARKPFARDDSTSTFMNSAVTIDVLRNDGDTGGDRPTLVGNPGCPSGGRAVVTADAQVRFDPPPDQVGLFRCTYEVTNSSGLRADASIIVTVRTPLPTNEPPIPADDKLTVEVGSVGTINVTDNDSDPDGPGELTVVSSTPPTLGTATRSGNVITYTAGDADGVTTIKYQVSDADGAVSTGQLTVIIVQKENVPPIATADVRNVFGPGVPTVFEVLANDTDPDATTGGLSLVSATRVSGDGTAVANGRLVTLTPDPGFVGSLVASYTISDGAGLEATSQVTLNVLQPLNRPPVARDDSNEIANGGSITAPVLFNDSDPDGDPLSISLTSGPDASLGSARLNNDGSIAFTASPGASGTAAIGYDISDGEFTSSATLRITVFACAESVPVAGSATLTTGYQQPIGVDLAAFGTNGTIVDVAGPPTYDGATYTPPAGENGNATITYAVVNGCRQRANGTITIDVNQDPITRPMSASIGRGEVREVPVSDIASDAEALQIVSSTGAPSWVATEPGRLVVQPPAGTPLGTVSWTTVVVDPGGLAASVPITVTVNNQLPNGAPDTVSVNPGPAVTLSPLDNDSDPDGANDALALQSVPTTLTFPNGVTGTLTIVGTRQISIDAGGGRGTTSFTYTVRDADGGVSGPVTVTVIGPPQNTPPDAADQSVAAVATVPISIALNASDADGDALTIATLSDPSGVVTSRAGLSLTITAPTAGTFQVTYTVSDGPATSRLATITITATEPPPAPTTTVLPEPTTTVEPTSSGPGGP